MTPQGGRSDPGSLPQGKRHMSFALRISAVGPAHRGERRCEQR